MAIESNTFNLPNFDFLHIDSTKWNRSKIIYAPYYIFVYFNPDCEHCQYQLKYAKEVEKDVLIIFVANVPVAELKDFVATNDMQDEKNIIFLIDEENNFAKVFQTNILPTIFIYGKDKQLKKRFNGETQAEAILKYLD